ncbi:MAG: hypothetical protein WB777_14160 [Mycobacterium sp.]
MTGLRQETWVRRLLRRFLRRPPEPVISPWLISIHDDRIEIHPDAVVTWAHGLPTLIGPSGSWIKFSRGARLVRGATSVSFIDEIRKHHPEPLEPA